jgi:hypothetical protein
MENIEIYFESIKQVYNQILEWKKERENRPEPLRQKITNFLSVSLLILFILSLLPIIPSLFVFLGSRFSWVIFNFHLNQATIWTYVLAWLISSVSMLMLFLYSLWLDSSINPPVSKEKLKPPQTLSSEQLTFIFAYQACKELKIFFVSHIDQHIEKALDSLSELQRSTNDIGLDVDFYEMYRYAPPEIRMREMEMRMYNERHYLQNTRYRTYTRSSLSSQISVAREFLKTFEKYSWFHNQLQDEGIKCLDRFVEDVNKLIDYPQKQRPELADHPVEKLTLAKKIQVMYFNNVFFRFIVWLLMLLAITSGLVYIASSKIPTLDINIMVSTVIATSVTGATALAVIGTKPKKTVQEIKDKSRQQLHNVIELDHDEDE